MCAGGQTAESPAPFPSNIVPEAVQIQTIQVRVPSPPSTHTRTQADRLCPSAPSVHKHKKPKPSRPTPQSLSPQPIWKTRSTLLIKLCLPLILYYYYFFTEPPSRAGVLLDSCTTLGGAPGGREWCATVPLYQGFFFSTLGGGAPGGRKWCATETPVPSF